MDAVSFIRQVIHSLSGEEPDLQFVEDEYGIVVDVWVYGNMGAVLGHSGTHFNAIRWLAKALGYNGKHRVKVRLHEQDKSKD